MRPAGASSVAIACSAASNATSLASSTASVPSRFAALNVPTSDVCSSPRPHGLDTPSVIPDVVVAIDVAVTSAPDSP